MIIQLLATLRRSFSENSKFFFKLFLALGIVVTFGISVQGQYVNWDDNVFILENEILKLPFWDAVFNFFSHFFHGDYLPLTLLTYLVEVSQFGETAAVQHISQIILHLLNSWLLLEVLLLADQKKREGATVSVTSGLNSHTFIISCAISAVFAFHPVQVESVAWISERKGLLSTLFLLLSLRSYLLWSPGFGTDRRDWGPLGYPLFYLASLLSKFTGVLLPVLMILWDILYFPEQVRRRFRYHLPLLAIGAGLGVVRIVAYTYALPNLEELAWDEDRLLFLIPFIFSALGHYLKLFFMPWNLSAVYPRFEFNNTTWALAGLAFGLAILILALFYRRRKWIEGKDLIFYSAFLFVFLAPVLQIVPRINFINDRYLYLPIIGLAGLFFTLIGDRWMLRTLPVLIVLPILSFIRTPVWSSSLNLWQDTALKTPLSAIAHNNLALTLLNEQRIGEAVPEFERVLVLGRADLTDNLGYNNLGSIYSNPRSPAPYYNLERGIEYFQQGIAACGKREDTFSLRYNLALAYLTHDQITKALEILKPLEQDLIEYSVDQKHVFFLQKVQNLIQDFQQKH